LLIASSFGKDQEEKRFPLAAALEILHTATLIHDDVIDNSRLRRGLPAAHEKYGQKDAVLIGDFLLSRCFLLTAQYTSAENAEYLARAISALCTMELEQDADRFRSSVSVRPYLRKITGKTALLFSLACHVGASEAKAPPLVASKLRRIGYNLGMAFQIIDDILDYTGEENRIRKPRGNDVKAGIVTLPLILALRRDTRGKLAALVGENTFPRSDFNKIIRLTLELGGIEESYRYSRRYTNRALKEIAGLPPGKSRTMMEKLTHKLLERNA
jgi:heptaprenyl diphosphate synthase